MEQLYNYNGTYEGIGAMHHRLKQLNEEDNKNISQATRLPRCFLLEKEKGDLVPLPSLAVRKPYHLHLKKFTLPTTLSSNTIIINIPFQKNLSVNK